MLRRLVVTALATTATAALAASPTALAAAPLPLPSLPLLDSDSGGSRDHLTVTVKDNEDTDGTYKLDCHPYGGDHPRIQPACDQLDKLTTWGKDPFAPVDPDAHCTMIYGGRATAHVTGTWAGRPVDATYNRYGGCEIARWDALVPVLPGARKHPVKVP
ncbi:SSI family serine proteinase inhibitor [Streptomyces melanogenes]|uniref:Subtilase-type protease inhibitor n=1 Tax=Streptomyces melanogenes TaxID=67326 RepID=A0ABZ1XNU2_9ACTN|nr:SSI family serine proteinase inhibitor [Streptomyces melanogenes]